MTKRQEGIGSNFVCKIGSPKDKNVPFILVGIWVAICEIVNQATYYLLSKEMTSAFPIIHCSHFVCESIWRDELIMYACMPRYVNQITQLKIRDIN